MGCRRLCASIRGLPPPRGQPPNSLNSLTCFLFCDKLHIVEMKFIAQILINALAIFLADYLVPGFNFEGDILAFLIAGLVLGLINIFVRPVLRFISTPLIVLSLGLFLLIINIILLWLAEYFVPELTIVGFWAYFWGVLIISALNMVFGPGKKKEN